MDTAPISTALAAKIGTAIGIDPDLVVLLLPLIVAVALSLFRQWELKGMVPKAVAEAMVAPIEELTAPKGTLRLSIKQEAANRGVSKQVDKVVQEVRAKTKKF